MRTYSFKVKEKEYVIRYTFNSICDMEEECKMGIKSILSDANIGFNTFRLLLWVGLKWQDRGITKQRAGEIFNNFIADGGDYNVLMTEMLTLLDASVSNPNKKENTELGE